MLFSFPKVGSFGNAEFPSLFHCGSLFKDLLSWTGLMTNFALVTFLHMPNKLWGTNETTCTCTGPAPTRINYFEKVCPQFLLTINIVHVFGTGGRGRGGGEVYENIRLFKIAYYPTILLFMSINKSN